jgi:hypothetical protein
MTSADAQRAIYVDFECLKERPALLGVLVGAEGEQLGQIIVDERLAPAKVANKRCRVAATADAVGALVAEASHTDRRIVGWSFFDRDRLIDARPDLKAEIHVLYVNALHVARPWRKTIHPAFAIVKEDPHAAKHTLDKYAALAGYPHVAAFRDAAPATWIRHTLAQLRATGGRYRRTTRQTKRDWHKLLDYNRHDCLALRHIVLTATRELEAWRSYERTTYCVTDAGREVCFRAGSKSAKLESLLRRHGASRWAFITAWNPASVQLTRRDNDARQQELRNKVEAEGYAWLPGEGRGDDPSWPPEDCLLVLGISRGKAVALGRAFGQLAILWGRRGDAARLLPSAPVA